MSTYGDPDAEVVVHPHFDECVGCGPKNSGGLKLQIHQGSDGLCRTLFRVSAEHQGPPRVAHGGILALALDELLGTAAYQGLGRMLVTEHLQVWYRKPTPVGALVYAMARLKQVDGHKAHLVGEARLNAPDGTIAAQAAATVVLLSHERYHALSGPPEAASGS